MDKDSTNNISRGLIFVDSRASSECSRDSRYQQLNLASEDEAVAKTPLQHQQRVEGMIASKELLAFPLTRTDDNFDNEDIAEELFPPAISPDSFAKKTAIKNARMLRKLLQDYGNYGVMRIEQKLE